MRAVGIDISDHTIEMIELRQRFGVFALLHYSTAATPIGAVSSGKILDAAKVAEAINTCTQAAKPNSLTAHAASFSIPESAVFTHTFTFPRILKGKDLDLGIRLQFADYFPHEPGDMIFDWCVTQKSEQTQSVFVGACEKSYVEQLQAVAEHAHIKPLRIGMESMTTARALLPVAKKTHAYMLIDSGAHVTTLTIFDAEGLRMTSTLNCGGDLLTTHMAKKRGMTFGTAEAFKKQMNLLDESSADVLPVVDDVYAAVCAEAKRMMHFYETESDKKITAVYLCGGASLLRGIDQYLQQHVGKPMQLGNALHRIRHHDILPNDTPPLQFANAIGLSLEALEPKHHVALNFLRKHS